MQVEKRNATRTVETKILMMRLPISLSCGSYTNLAFKRSGSPPAFGKSLCRKCKDM
jgi:hypothetical protein